MTDVHGIDVTGGSFPARIWAAYMKKALAGIPPSDFEKPKNTEWVTAEVDPESRLLASKWCPDTEEVTFLKGSEPTKYCDLHGPREIAVPKVTGLPLAEATAQLEDLLFEVSVNEQVDFDAPSGTVLAQDPEAGKKLLQGNTVELTVAKGPAAGTVPKVTGKSAAAARDILQQAGYEVSERSAAGQAEAGTVAAQDPAAGTALEAGKTVTITVSTGQEAQTTTTAEPPRAQVPQVIGLRLQRAVGLIEQAGLAAEVVETIPSQDANLSGTVANQTPAGGSSVPPGTTVALTVYARTG
jgi:serine/threonine-protein kinase